MEKQINTSDQNTQPIGQDPIGQPLQNSEKTKVNYWMTSTLILAVLFIGNLGVYVFLLRQTNPPVSTESTTQPPPSSEFACSQDNDCLVGIRASACCSCPQAVHQELIGVEDWQLYVPGKGYLAPRPPRGPTRCTGVVCAPCQPLTQPICQNGQCQFSPL